MLSTLLVVVLVVAVGARAGDNLRVRQQEIILGKLPEALAIAYYELLRRRARKVTLLRAIAVSALIVLFYSYKYRIARPKPPAPPGPTLTLAAPDYRPAARSFEYLRPYTR